MDLSLDGVDPDRREEMLRRIAILQRYAALDAPTLADDEAHAREMGVGPAQFLRLARVWTEHRRPSLLPGAVRRKRRTARPTSDAAKAIIDAAVRGAPRNARNAEIARSVGKRLERAGLQQVDAAVVRSAIRRFREEAALSDDERIVAVDQVGIDLPVDTGRARALPILHVAFRADTGRILAWRLERHAMAVPDAAALLLELVARRGEAARAVVLRDGGDRWSPLLDVLDAAGLAGHRGRGAFRPGQLARRAFGATIGDVAIRSRSTLRVDAKRASPSMLMLHARARLREAIGLHHSTAGRQAGLALDLGPARTDPLRIALGLLAGAGPTETTDRDDPR